jgi:alkylation response protein AidB-like acyl-CoA dehydrogenase
MRIVAEGLARVLAPEPLTAAAVLTARLVLHGSNDELKRTLLTGLAAGDLIAGTAWQESSGRDQPEQIETLAQSAGNGFVVTGVKRLVVPADDADGYVVSARDRGELLLCWVPPGVAGMSAEVQSRSDGSFCQTLRLDRVQVPASAIVATGETAAAALARAIDEANVMVAAELFGRWTAPPRRLDHCARVSSAIHRQLRRFSTER